MLLKRLVCLLSLQLSWFASYAFVLADEKPISPAVSLIVTTNSAPLMAGDQQIGSIPLGTVLIASRMNGNWRYSAEERGWVHLRDLITPQEAITRFTKEIEEKPTSRAYQLRGIAWMSQRDWVKAAQDFEKAYDLGESGVPLHLNLGECYQQMGELVSAVLEYDAILKAYPDDFEANLARGNVFLLQGQFPAAARDLEKASSINPKSADALVAWGVSLRMLGRYEEAISQYEKALTIDAARADALSNRGYARKSLGDLPAALKDYEAAVKLAPDSAGIRNDLAWLLATSADETMRNGERAIQLSEAVCKETQNKNGEYLDTLAAAYASAGRFPAAIEAAKLAISTMGDHPGTAKTQERLELYQAEKPYVEPLATAEKVQ